MLIDTLRSDMKEAMKAKDQDRLKTLRSMIAAIQTEEVSQSSARELSQSEVEKVLASEAKKRQEAADAFNSAGRPQMAEQELSEKALIEQYLPEKLTDAELDQIISEALSEGAFSQMSDMGNAMKAVNAKVQNRAEGSVVAAKVRAALAG